MEPAEDLVERVLRDALAGGRNGATQTVVVKDEGKSHRAWNAFYLMLGLNVALLAMFLSHDRKIERLEDYLQVIYSQVPSLRDSENGRQEENQP